MSPAFGGVLLQSDGLGVSQLLFLTPFYSDVSTLVAWPVCLQVTIDFLGHFFSCANFVNCKHTLDLMDQIWGLRPCMTFYFWTVLWREIFWTTMTYSYLLHWYIITSGPSALTLHVCKLITLPLASALLSCLCASTLTTLTYDGKRGQH